MIIDRILDLLPVPDVTVYSSSAFTTNKSHSIGRLVKKRPAPKTMLSMTKYSLPSLSELMDLEKNLIDSYDQVLSVLYYSAFFCLASQVVN